MGASCHRRHAGAAAIAPADDADHVVVTRPREVPPWAERIVAARAPSAAAPALAPPLLCASGHAHRIRLRTGRPLTRVRHVAKYTGIGLSVLSAALLTIGPSLFIGGHGEAGLVGLGSTITGAVLAIPAMSVAVYGAAY